MQHVIFQDEVVNIGSNDDGFETTTVARLKEMAAMHHFKDVFKNVSLKFNGIELDNNRTLHSYNILNGSQIEVDKYYNPFLHFGLIFTDAPDTISDNNNGQLRSVASCGHAVDPNSLTLYCRNLIDNFHTFKLTCPALVDGGNRCNKEWDYVEVRKLALLSKSEMKYFERMMSDLSGANNFDFSKCPNCRSILSREDSTNLRVMCPLCVEMNKKKYTFCWKCKEEWSVSIDEAFDTCGRENCSNPQLLILKTADLINLKDVKSLPPVPCIRACPRCFCLCEHDGRDCKNMVCHGCQIEFCFACLEITDVCSETSDYYSPCAKPVADIQNKIPLIH